jgi:hypothetical protein
MYAVIPVHQASPAMVTILWDETKCGGPLPRKVHVDVYGRSLVDTANVYLLRGKHVCGALATVPEVKLILYIYFIMKYARDVDRLFINIQYFMYTPPNIKFLKSRQPAEHFLLFKPVLQNENSVLAA